MEQFEAYFQRADTDRDGRISGNEAVVFFQAFNLPKQVLAQIWTYADQNKSGFLGRPEFFNALKLVTVAQTKRDLTADIVRAALYGPASAKIPAPQINIATTLGPHSNLTASTSPAQLSRNQIPNQGVVSNGPHGVPSQQIEFMRPPRPPPPSSGIQSQIVLPSQGLSVGGSMSIPHGNNFSDSSGGNTDGYRPTIPSTVSNRSLSTPITQLRPSQTIGLVQPPSSNSDDISSLGSIGGKEESKSVLSTGNGFTSNSEFGDMFSVTPSRPKYNSPGLASSAGSTSATSAGTVSSSRNQPTNQPYGVSQPSSTQTLQFQPMEKTNQSILPQNSSAFSAAAGNLTSVKSQPPWPKVTQSDVQKYSKVFVQVDADKDGKITGEEAKNLFLSWRLPREVLKQVWDLSDQDNDSMLSLREFCIALYLMERYREGRPLPTVLPNTSMFDEVLLPVSTQQAAAYGSTVFKPTYGVQHPQGTKSARPITSVGGGRPPRPVPVSQSDEPIQKKPEVPALEKHLLDQLSSEEQDSLNKKFQEAKDAEKKVADLEKDILEAKQKVQFFHAKMQELILYKSRCDNRLNEITEKVVADKRVAESLAKKYEEKYKEVGDVASKLTIEEATFRDIQEQKMELYRSIAKLEQENADSIQDRGNQIQLDLEELVRALNERCKTYGLRGKPTSLVELPFGWQSGIQVAAADWDEVWDKFEDEGFTYVKELTLEVQNSIAPPKPKSALIREKVAPLGSNNSVKSPSKAVGKSDLPNSLEELPENEISNTHNLEQTPRSPSDSPAGNNAFDSPSKKFYDANKMMDINVNGSSYAFDSQSEFSIAESISGDRGFDERGWGSFDPHYDTDATAWDVNPVTPKDTDRERHSGNSLFGSDEWVLNPIRTGPTGMDTPKQGPFFDSVPSTPLYNSGNSPQADSGMFTRSLFADSVPSTPMYNFNASPKGFKEGLEEPYSFDSFSRNESFNMSDSGPFGSRESFSRFDSMRSTRDSDYDQGYFGTQETSSFARFDSFRSTADSDYNFGSVHPPNSFARFDSIRSTTDSDYRGGFPSFDDAADPFGSGEPFRTSFSAETPRKDSDSWKTF